ncbi:MAG: L-tyrosine/L-tryptophan isonitrile synthase family protein [Patescibacteria group bacterium]|nr:L-tyrosine/L-tryptophan isonitrile synthase family protein [Patescibacteria group bacterium]
MKKHYENKFDLLLKKVNPKEYLNLIKKNDSLNQESLSYLETTILKSFNQLSERFIEKIKKKNLNYNEATALAIYHYPFRKQKIKGPSYNQVLEKVINSFRERRPIFFVGLMFTRKNICYLKTEAANESELDLAEIISFYNLNTYCRVVGHFYPFGCQFIILSEGKRFLEAFDLCLPYLLSYQKKLQNLIKEKKLTHLKIIDYEDFLELFIPEKKKTLRKMMIEEAKKKYEKLYRFLDLEDIKKTEKSLVDADPIVDQENAENNFVPLWRSIRNSLPYHQITYFSRELGLEPIEVYMEIMKKFEQKLSDPKWEKLRKEIVVYSFKKAIIHNIGVLADRKAKIFPEKFISPYAFRVSINPKPGDHLGFSLIRETTSRVQPWHGKLVFYTKKNSHRLNTTCLTSLEARTNFQAVGVLKNKKIWFLSTEESIKLIEEREFILSLI